MRFFSLGKGSKASSRFSSWALSPTTPLTQITEVFLLLFVHKK
jgi:hypothetical protein